MQDLSTQTGEMACPGEMPSRQSETEAWKSQGTGAEENLHGGNTGEALW